MRARSRPRAVDLLFRQNKVALLALGPNFTVVRCNQAVQALLPVAPGQSFAPLVQPEDWPAMATRLTSTTEQFRCAIQVANPDGPRLIEVLAQRSKAPGVDWLLKVLDVTDAQSHHRYLDAIVDAGLHLNWFEWEYHPSTGHYVMSPTLFELVFGERVGLPQILRAETVHGVIHPDDLAMLDQRQQEATRTGLSYQTEFRMVPADGQVRWLQAIGTPTRGHGGVPILAGIVIDVTADRLRAETIRTARWEALQLLAGGIAHDLNNQLAVIMGHLSLMDSVLPSAEEPVAAWLHIAAQATEQATRLTRQLLTLSRKVAIVRQAVRVRSLLETHTAWTDLRTDIHVDLRLPDNLWAVHGDPTQLAQVVDNLVRNAVQAMPGGGTIRIEGRNLPADDAVGQPTIELYFEDDGPGIPEERRERLFDPYYSTKPGGHGLGLACTAEIVHQHHGTIRVGSATIGGAQFCIRLPALPEVPEEVPSTPVAPIVALKGTVLIIDDDDGVLTTVQAIAESLGLETELARGGVAALQWLAHHACDAVLLDWVLTPAMTGRVVLEAIRVQYPVLPVIVSSGFVDMPIPEGVPVLPKPFTRDALGHTLGPLLDGHQTNPGSTTAERATP